MKNARMIGKTLTILLGVIGVTALISSCKKLRSCTCTTTYTYLGSPSYSYTQTESAVIKKCSELDASASYGTYSVTKSCVKI